MQRELIDLQIQLNNVEGERADLKAKLYKEQRANRQLREEIRKANEANLQHVQDAGECAIKLDELQRMVQERTTDVNELISELRSVRREKDALAAMVAQLEAEKARTEDELDRQCNVAYQHAANECRERMNGQKWQTTYNNAKNDFKSALEKANRRIDMLQNDSTNKMNQISNLKKDAIKCQELLTENAQLTEELNQVLKRTDEAEDTAMKARQQTRQYLADWMETLKEHKKELKTKAEHQERLERELERKTEHVEQLETEVGELAKKLKARNEVELKVEIGETEAESAEHRTSPSAEEVNPERPEKNTPATGGTKRSAPASDDKTPKRKNMN